MNKLGAYRKKAGNLENVKERYAFLVEGLVRPGKVTQAAKSAVSGQRAFCALSIPGSKIAPIALNTLKTLANELYSQEPDANGDGFAYLNRLRGRLQKLLEGLTNSRSVENKAKRRADSQHDLEAKRDAAELQSVERAKAYLDLYGKLQNFVKKEVLDDGTRFTLFKLLEQHHALFSGLFAPCTLSSQKPTDAFNEEGKTHAGGVVISIRPEK